MDGEALTEILNQFGLYLIVIIVSAFVVKKDMINGIAAFVRDSIKDTLKINAQRVENDTRQADMLAAISRKIDGIDHQQEVDRLAFLSHIAEIEAMMSNLLGNVQATLLLLRTDFETLTPEQQQTLRQTCQQSSHDPDPPR